MSRNKKKTHNIIITNNSNSTASLASKYFKKWREKSANSNRLTPASINQFVDGLIAIKYAKIESAKRAFNVKPPKCEVSSEQFGNRYKAQQNIILMQKSKILEQEQRIEELQYGKICEEMKSSVQNQQSAIKQILSKLSMRTKIAEGIRIVPEPEEVQMKINKVPNLVRKMEERARQRELKRQIIKERKQLIEEEKKRLLEEQVAKKRAQDEEEKKRNLQVIKERRKREVEEEKRKIAEREKFLAKLRVADAFCIKQSKIKTLRRFRALIKMREDAEHLSEVFYEAILARKSLIEWQIYVRNEKREKDIKSCSCYAMKLKKKYFQAFILNRNIAKQSWYVAMDFYDYQVQCKMICKFYLIVNAIKIRRQHLLRSAQRHFNSKLLVQSFYQWKSLPAVLHLERAKEERKRKWREKVREILPDYQPPIFD